jgi:fructose-bisphosphate aldolase, class II
LALATPEQYVEMLDAARRDGYAYPAVNVSSSTTLNAALAGFADARSDGIVQLTPSGAEFASGTAVDAAAGARALAAFARQVADDCPVLIALHTDHCPPAKVDAFLRPLLEESAARARRDEPPLYHSHMFDGSSLPLAENLEMAAELLQTCREANVILEIEIGVVGGEEDGLDARGVADERLYSKPGDAVAVVERLGAGEHGRYLLAATFGNVHGVYTSVNAKLRPAILCSLRDAVVERFGAEAAFDFVFHGGSGSTPEQIHEAIGYGVVKFNLDTDLQYAYTRAVADHMFRNYDGVLKTDGSLGDTKSYDPRVWSRAAQTAMAERIGEATRQLGSAGHTLKPDLSPDRQERSIPLPHPEVRASASLSEDSCIKVARWLLAFRAVS